MFPRNEAGRTLHSFYSSPYQRAQLQLSPGYHAKEHRNPGSWKRTRVWLVEFSINTTTVLSRFVPVASFPPSTLTLWSMAPTQTRDASAPLLFDDEQAEIERGRQTPRRHQHVVHPNHQRPKVTFGPKASGKARPKARSISDHSSPSLSPSLSGSHFDPFDALCVTNLSGLSQTMFQFGKLASCGCQDIRLTSSHH